MAGIKIRRVDLYSDDALTGTTELTDDEMGVYVRVWLLMYATGAPITIEKLRSVCKSHGTRFKSIIGRLETLGKVMINGQRITCKRCEKEIQRALNRLTKASQNGSKGGRHKDLAKAAGFDQDNPTSLSSLQQPTKKDSEAIASGVAGAPSTPEIDPVKGLFDRGVKLLVRSGVKPEQARTLIGKWRKSYSDPLVMAAIVHCEDHSIIDPIPYITRFLENHRGQNGNGQASLTPASQRFRASRQDTVDAALRVKREREARERGTGGS